MIMTNAVASLILAAASIFGHNMVLQREIPVPVWGTAAPGEEVVVAVAGQQVKAVADASGRWMAKLAPLSAGGPLTLEIKGKGASLQFTNVLVGEVWIASGQSNMEMALGSVRDSTNEIAAANNPMVRFTRLGHVSTNVPMTSVAVSWQLISPSNAAGFSAVAWFFARDVQKQVGVPVGIIQTAWGGTVVEAWMPTATLKALPDTQPIFERWEKLVADHPALRKKYDEDLPRLKQEWEAAAAKAKAEGKPAPRLARPPPDPRSPNGPANLWHGMIHPLVPVAIRGAIWYQGESNAGRAEQYQKLFPAMIRAWREAWGQGEFPFHFVQLANFMAATNQPAQSTWAELREAQAMTLSLPNTAMAAAIDIGEEKDIHPKNKQEVGRRLALTALARVYGKKEIVDSGPAYKSMAVEGAAIRLTFDNPGGGLATRDSTPPKGFAIAGEDMKFAWADAKIEGETVVLSSAAVPKPVAARYAWADNPDTANVVNKAGLPMFPFRTDTWPGITAAKK
jgi:sialate O-acetylesterase